MRRRELLATGVALPTAGLAGCLFGVQSSCTRGYSVELQPRDRTEIVTQVVQTAPETVITYTDYLLTRFVAAPEAELRTLADNQITAETFIESDGTYYQARRAEGSVEGVRVTRTVSLPDGSPDPEVVYANLQRRDKAAFLAAGATRGLVAGSPDDTRGFVEDNSDPDDPLELELEYPTTDVAPFVFPEPEDLLLGINDTVVRLARTRRVTRPIETARIRFVERGTTPGDVADAVLAEHGARLTDLSASDRRFIEAAIEAEQSVCERGPEASPTTETPTASETLLETLRNARYVKYDGQWYEAEATQFVV